MLLRKERAIKAREASSARLSAGWQARALCRMLGHDGNTVDGLRELIAVPLKIKRILESFAKAHRLTRTGSNKGDALPEVSTGETPFPPAKPATTEQSVRRARPQQESTCHSYPEHRCLEARAITLARHWASDERRTFGDYGRELAVIIPGFPLPLGFYTPLGLRQLAEGGRC